MPETSGEKSGQNGEGEGDAEPPLLKFSRLYEPEGLEGKEGEYKEVFEELPALELDEILQFLELEDTEEAEDSYRNSALDLPSYDELNETEDLPENAYSEKNLEVQIYNEPDESEDYRLIEDEYELPAVNELEINLPYINKTVSGTPDENLEDTNPELEIINDDMDSLKKMLDPTYSSVHENMKIGMNLGIDDDF